MKWLQRTSSGFDVAKSSAGVLVLQVNYYYFPFSMEFSTLCKTNVVFLQEALDCFCCCLAKPEKRLPLSEAIAAKLNIVQTTVRPQKFTPYLKSGAKYQ